MPKINQRLLDASRFFGISVLFFLPISVGMVNTFAALFALSVFINRDFWHDLADLWKIQVVKAALILLGALLIATLYSSAPLGAAFDFATKYRKLLFIPLLIWAFRDSGGQGKARWTLLISLSLVLLTSYTNYLGLTDRFRPSGYNAETDAALVFHLRITQGIFMALLFCLAITMSRNEARTPIKWGLCLIAVLAAIDVMVLVNSRTGQMCWIVATLWMMLNASIRIWPTHRIQSAAVILGGLALIIGLLMLSAQQKASRLNTVISEIEAGSETSSGLRLEFYALSWKMIKAHPLLGTGTGSAAIESDRMRLAHQTSLSGTMNHPHNEYLLMMIQLGVPGLLLLLWLFGAVYAGSRQLMPADRDVLQPWLIIFVVGCFPNALLLDFNEGHMFVFLTGIFLSPLYPIALARNQR